MNIKKLVSVIISAAIICTSLTFSGFPVHADGTDAFYADGDIAMVSGNNRAFYKRNEVPIDVTNDKAAPYKENGSFYIPLKFIAQCMNVRLIQDIDTVGKYVINENDIAAVMKDNVPYISATKAAELTGKTCLTKDNCIILSENGDNGTYDKIFAKLENDFENTYHTVPDESKGRILAQGGGSLWGRDYGGESSASFETIDGELRFTTTVTTKNDTNNINDINYRFYNNAEVKKNDVGWITFYAKRAEGCENGKIAVTVQDEKYYAVFTQEIVLDSEWKKYSLAFKSDKAIAANTRTVFIAVGYGPQSVRIADFKAVVFTDVYSENEIPQTKLTYKNEEDKAWQADALKSIEENRKNDTVIKVLDDKGVPMKDAEVEITQRDHLFNLGTEVSQFYVTETPWSTTTEWDVLPREENIKNFKTTLKEYFNTVIPGNAYKWASWADGRAENSDLCAEVINDMGLRMRGHVLWWDMKSFCPSNAEITEETVNNHITEMLTRYKGKAVEWDVLNEPVLSRGLLLKGKEYGSETIIKDWFDKARATDPDAILYVNEKDISGEDGDNFENFKKIVTGMIKNNVDFDAVGIQAHMSSMPESPKKIAEQVKTFTDMGKKASVTEYDMASRNEQLQARYLKDILIASYANPEVLGFSMWGHWDVDHWRRISPMFRDDWTPKPGAYIWKGLFDYSFASNVRGKTDKNGIVGAELYEGIYDVKVTKDGIVHTYSVNVDKEGAHTVRFENQLYDLPYIYDFENRTAGERLFEDFNNNAAQWGGYVQGDVTIAEDKESGHAVKAAAAKGTIRIMHNIAQTNNNVVLKLSVKAEKRGRNRYISEWGPNDDPGSPMLIMKDGDGGGTALYYTTSGGETYLTEIPLGIWFDCNFNINPPDKAYKVVITDKSGNKLAEGANGVLSKAKYSDMRKWSFNSFGENSAELMYMDNVSLSKAGECVTKLVQAENNGSVPDKTNYFDIYTSESILNGAKAVVYKVMPNGSVTAAENAEVKISSDKVRVTLNEPVEKGCCYKVHFINAVTVFGNSVRDAAAANDASVNFLESVKLVSEDNGNEKEIKNINAWDGKSPIRLIVNTDEEYYGSGGKDIFISQYSENEELIGIQRASAPKNAGDLVFDIPISDKLAQIKVFVWNDGMRPELSASVF